LTPQLTALFRAKVSQGQPAQTIAWLYPRTGTFRLFRFGKERFPDADETSKSTATTPKTGLVRDPFADNFSDRDQRQGNHQSR
jgi:hypothetical protein